MKSDCKSQQKVLCPNLLALLNPHFVILCVGSFYDFKIYLRQRFKQIAVRIVSEFLSLAFLNLNQITVDSGSSFVLASFPFPRNKYDYRMIIAKLFYKT